MNATPQPELLPPLPSLESWRTHWRWLVDPDQDRWLLPLTGLWIIGLDWLLFSEEIITFEVATPIIATVGFLLGAIGTYRFQRRFGGDNRTWAAIKALLAGVAVGLPLPLAGTFIGGWILMNSGLHGLKNRVFATAAQVNCRPEPGHLRSPLGGVHLLSDLMQLNCANSCAISEVGAPQRYGHRSPATLAP